MVAAARAFYAFVYYVCVRVQAFRASMSAAAERQALRVPDSSPRTAKQQQPQQQQDEEEVRDICHSLSLMLRLRLSFA